MLLTLEQSGLEYATTIIILLAFIHYLNMTSLAHATIRSRIMSKAEGEEK